MLDLSGFIVRISGRQENTYYIDCNGLYRADQIAKAGGVDAQKLRAIYLANGGELNESVGVYYFNSIPGAKNAIAKIIGLFSGTNGRSVYLTETEIAYIRKSLIAFGGYPGPGIDSRVTDAILDKFNR
jgi:hypothetical protein